MRGVVISAGPCAHLLTFGARRPGKQFLQLGESARTAAVLGRACALAAGARRVYRDRVRRGAGLDGKLVFPAVAEVVLVTGQVPGLHQVADPELLLVERLEIDLRVCGAIVRPAILNMCRWEFCHPIAAWMTLCTRSRA